MCTLSPEPNQYICTHSQQSKICVHSVLSLNSACVQSDRSLNSSFVHSSSSLNTYSTLLNSAGSHIFVSHWETFPKDEQVTRPVNATLSFDPLYLHIFFTFFFRCSTKEQTCMVSIRLKALLILNRIRKILFMGGKLYIKRLCLSVICIHIHRYNLYTYICTIIAGQYCVCTYILSEWMTRDWDGEEGDLLYFKDIFWQ